ncbi:C6 zinc finger protein [Drechmeria coniospora]|uniref:C6 zinc finger protein n=1 Tax=Drechmeria coniospora TaxID=98403 RepID=A0A151GY59_DRECN|nr:C6 zinc finger protein [Drechmeria coniospora]KYK61972.1 C6 zinc finger protein [Drechmeria coniospora]
MMPQESSLSFYRAGGMKCEHEYTDTCTFHTSNPAAASPLHTSSASSASQPRPAQPGPAREQPEKKRRRPALACEQCRRRKIKCDRNSPCGHCTRARIASCTYVPTHVPATRSKRCLAVKTSDPASASSPAAAGSGAHPSARASVVRTLQGPSAASAELRDGRPRNPLPHLATVAVKARVPTQLSSGGPVSRTGSASESSNNNVDQLVARVHELEEKLAKVVQISDGQGSAFGSSAISPVFSHSGTVSKSRYFGSSHWISVADLVTFSSLASARVAASANEIDAKLPTEYTLLGLEEAGKTDFYHALIRCKALGRRIKQNRSRPLSSTDIGRHLPPRHVCDELVGNYLRTFEGVLRIVHVPSFKADYQRYWQKPDAAVDGFVIQMQLCMALGATLHDDLFTMRATSQQWIYEAQLWLMLPPKKSRMTILGIQIMCLLVLAKSICGVGPDLTWIIAGALVRKAMSMGLHRDPSHLGKMTTFRAEMRRRLWATILELNLQCSFEAGGSPLLSNSHYDTQPPANMDDELLGDEPDGDGQVGNALDTPTQVSVQVAILKSLPLRLDLLVNTNNFRTGQSYDEVLRLNSELTKACRELSRKLSTLRSKAAGVPTVTITDFHISMSEMLLYRCFHALHQTFISKSFDDHRFYFSRRMCLDSALKLMHIWRLSGPHHPNPAGGRSDFDRIIVNGTGMFRYIPVQALFFIAVELIHQKQGQSTSLGYLPSLGDLDLRSCLVASLSWTIDRIRSGETNGKGHCFVAAVLAHVDALSDGLGKDEVDNAILQAALASVSRCLEALEDVAEREGLVPHEPTTEMMQMEDVTDTQLDWMGDWVWDDTADMSWQQRPFEGMLPDQFINQ